MAGAGFHSLAKLRDQMCTADRGVIPLTATTKITTPRIATGRSLNLRADCHRPELTACIPCYLSADLGNPP
jgi:hypothetical protein